MYNFDSTWKWAFRRVRENFGTLLLAIDQTHANEMQKHVNTRKNSHKLSQVG